MNSYANPSWLPPILDFYEFMSDIMDFVLFLKNSWKRSYSNSCLKNIEKNIVKNIVNSWKFENEFSDGFIGRCADAPYFTGLAHPTAAYPEPFGSGICPTIS